MTTTQEDMQVYPGGETHPGYKLAIKVWIVLFLVCLCFGLLNYIGGSLKSLAR
jgi:hypothetical protein